MCIILYVLWKILGLLIAKEKYKEKLQENKTKNK